MLSVVTPACAASNALVSAAAYAGHFVLEMEEAHDQSRARQQALLHRRQLPKRATDLGPPLFKLTGLAIGNGLTDPATQAGPFAFILMKAGDRDHGGSLAGHRLRWCFIFASMAWSLCNHERL